MKRLLLLPLLLGFSVPAIAHNEFNVGDYRLDGHHHWNADEESEEVEGDSITDHMQELMTNGST